MSDKAEEKDSKKAVKHETKPDKSNDGKVAEKTQNVTVSATPCNTTAGRTKPISSPAARRQISASDRGISKSPEKGTDYRGPVRNSNSKDSFHKTRGRDDGPRGVQGSGRPPKRSTEGNMGKPHHSTTILHSPKAGSGSAAVGSSISSSSIRSPMDMTKKTVPDHGRSFSDDSRMSKLMSRLIRRDGDRDRRMIAAKQLREFFLSGEGSKVIIKSSDDLLASLQDIFFERIYKDIKQEVAMCIGSIGSAMGNDAHRYFQWLFGQASSMVDEDTKLLYLQALFETLKCDEKKQSLKEFLPMVMNHLQTILENADTPEMLTAVVDVILHLSKHHPHVFTSHFRDTVDILVGWHIDSTQKDALTDFTSGALITFHQYWISDLNFSVTLLGQFLEDMEAYAEDLCLLISGQSVMDEDMPSPEECVTKIAALLRVFTTVVRSLGDSFSPTKAQQVSREYISEILERIVKCVEGANHCLFSDRVLMAANQCLSLLISQLQSNVTYSNETLLPFIVNQAYHTKTFNNPFIISWLSLTLKVIEQSNTQLPVSFCAQLLGPGSSMHVLRMYNNDEVLTQLMAVYHSVMGLKSVPLLEEAYRLVVGDLQTAYNSLLEHAGDSYRCTAVTNNAFSDVTYNTKEAETVIIFNLSALTEIGNTKSNLIGMWALSPSIFDLLCDQLKPLHKALAQWFPAVQYATLYALYSHCTRHGNFLSSSTLLTRDTALEGSVLANVSPATSSNFTTVLTILADLLRETYHSFDTKCLALKWTSETIHTLQTNQHVYLSKEFLQVGSSLVSLGYDTEYQLCMSAAQCLQTLLKTNTFPDSFLNRCMEMCMVKICDNNADTCQMFADLLKRVPINITTRLNGMLKSDDDTESDQKSVDRRDIQATWLARRSHINRVPMGTFHTHNFRNVMAYILDNKRPSNIGTCDWIERLYFTSQRPDKVGEKKDDSIKLSDVVEGNDSLLWFWATWEAAQFCVLARLRTPLGKPQDTFMSIEAVLKKYAAEVKKYAEMADNVNNTNNKSGEKEEVYRCHQRVALLLQFLEQLERLLYNAYEGCAAAMPASPKAVRTFFRTNRGTCQEWLSRIRTGTIIVALHAGKHSMVVRQAFELLKEMKETGNTQGGEFEQILIYLVQALCKLQCPDSIHGLYTWCKDIIGRKLPWIKAAVEKADGRYEVAAQDYKVVLKTLLGLDNHIEDKENRAGDSGRVTPNDGPLNSRDDGLQKKLITGKQQESEQAVAGFIVNEVTESYLSLNDWSSVMEWQQTLTDYRSDHNGNALQKIFSGCVDMNYIKALSSFDEGLYPKVREYLELVPGASLSDLSKDSLHTGILWDTKHTVRQAQKQMIRAATLLQELKPNGPRGEIIRCLELSELLTQSLVKVEALEWPVHNMPQVVMELCAASVLRRQVEDKRNKSVLMPLSERIRLDVVEHEMEVMSEAMRLTEFQLQLQGFDRKTELNSQLSRLELATARLARKQQNYKFAEKLMLRHVRTLLTSHTGQDNKQALHESIPKAITSIRAANGGVNQGDMLQTEREAAKLLHQMGNHKDGLEILSGSIVGYVRADQSSQVKDRGLLRMCGELTAKSLLHMVKWLQVDHKSLGALSAQLKVGGQGDDANVSRVLQNLKVLLDLERRGMTKDLGLNMDNDCDDVTIGDNPMMSDTDAIIGRLYHLSTMESPSLAKAWFALAGWCYKWGRKAIDNASHGSVELLPEERSEVLNLLPKGTSDEDTESVLGVLSQIHTLGTSEEDISDQDQSLYDDGAETTRKQLLASCLTLHVASDDTVERLLDVWRGVVHRVYYYYQLSAKAYFTYLHFNASARHSSENNEDGNVIATLRVLRLLVKHAWELREVLEDGLAQTPTAPWKGIIPQLFSRLNHPEGYVRQSVSDLLCRVAQDAPHLIVYPAVVGCGQIASESKDTSRDVFLNEYLAQTDDNEEGMDPEDRDQTSQEEGDEGNMDDPSKTMLQHCLSAIVDTLSYHNPRMISEVQQLVQELRRITLLWDELWLGTLNQHHPDIIRRMTQLETEVKKVLNNSSLSKEERTAIIREKHRTIMKPTLYTLEKLKEITAETAETNHEQWFQDTYGKLIDQALESLYNPSNPSSPQASWHLFKQLHHSLQQRAQKRSSLMLQMSEISPRLSGLQGSVIPMPGLSPSGQTVTVAAINNTVQILPTKTKPKKIMFIGSDGNKHPYLFKGLEDLHLDERIMQFLSIVNNMFAGSNRERKQRYRARHYSVTPLGPRSGLIQWVDGATPLFSLYKRWQQREAMALALKPSSSGTNAAPNIPRPSEVFYNKLTPALKEKGITVLDNHDNRKDWPISTLKKVLEELMTDTPSDLLARELWCSSTGPNEWWHITQVYAVSTAVMSMIGYIIGLGDRHLDNVLVDLATGEVVHIDYNVCFEKGKGLRVPEKVPFRMTQNIEVALGLTGIEGTFRIACEHVIKMMRKGRETLLTLLEAFVYDPLVDWTTGNEGGYAGAFYGGGPTGTAAGEAQQSKKEMEMEITRSMFSIRIAEMKSVWFKNSDDMRAVLPKLEGAIQTWLRAAEEHLTGLASKDSLVEQKMILDEALTDPQHSLYTLNERFGEYSIVKATRETVLEALQEKINEWSPWHTIHEHVIESVQGPVFQKMYADIAKSPSLGPASFATASEFLQGAGQGQIVSQCEQIESELSTCLQHRRSVLRTALDILHTYTTITSQFGQKFVQDNRSYQFLHWSQELVCDFSTLKCAEIVDQFDKKYGASSLGPSPVQYVLNTERKLQNNITEANTKLVKLMERRHQDVSETTGLEVQVQDTLSTVRTYLQDNGVSGTLSLLGVILTALCQLNRRYLVMEGAAAAAGDRLMDLTSRDGDWFLDELCSMSGNIDQFLAVLKEVVMVGGFESSHYLQAAFTATHNIYVSLQEMNLNFRTIIIPEALKTIQAEEPSVLEAVAGLEMVIAMGGQPLEALLSQLEIIHRNAIMGIENVDMETLTGVHKMRVLFNELLQGPEQEGTDLSPGQMLLMGFNGLFTRLDNEFSDMLDSLDAASVPDIWRKVDVIREAKAFQISSFVGETKTLLADIFFVKQLLAMHEFLDMCKQFARTLQGTQGGVCYDDDQMAKPVKKFIAEYVRKKVLGFPSQILGYIICTFVDCLGLDVTAEIELKDIGAESKAPLDDLCKKAVDGCLRNEQFHHHHLTQASSVTGSYDNAWRKHDLARRLDSNMTLLKSSIQKAQLQLARYQWLHEDMFTQAGRLHQQMVMPNRSTVMSEMRKSVQGLLAGDTTIASCQERCSQLEASITQRLKWAAGANPTLNNIQQQFDETSSYRQQLIEEEGKLSTEVVNLCQGILHFEAMRTRTPEAVSSDTTFLQLMNRCNESCILTENTASTVTDVEEVLMTTKTPSEGKAIDEKWMKQTLDLIKKETKLTTTKIGQLKGVVDSGKEGVKSEVTGIRSVLGVHHKLMSEIRSILKSLAKYEEQEEEIYDERVRGIRDYLNTYKNFSENFTTALKIVISDDVTKEGMEEASSIINSLMTQINRIYDDLVDFAPPLIVEGNDDGKMSPLPGDFASAVKKPFEKDSPISLQKRPSHVNKEHLTGITTPTSSPQFVSSRPIATSSAKKSEKVSRDPRTGKAIQERNSYAVSVWRRVKMKLDGRDPDSNKRLSVAEQVDYVIKEATNLDNLSVLYEGWTPWV